VAKPELGSKRQCQNCGAKFFDLNKDPIVCPKCGTVFQGARVVRAPAKEEVEEADAAAPASVDLFIATLPILHARGWPDAAGLAGKSLNEAIVHRICNGRSPAPLAGALIR